MPISVSCPSCAAGFKVKDEYAGKRARCPKCGNALTIPAPAADFEMVDDEPAPAPAKAARPVAAKPVTAKPRVVEEDEDEPVIPKRKRGANSDDEDEKPKAKRRRDEDDEDDDKPKAKSKRKRATDDDDDDDRPRKKRRRDDDEDEPKKKSALPLILGVVAGVVVLGGGITAAVLMMQGSGQAKATGTMPTLPKIGGGIGGTPPTVPGGVPKPTSQQPDEKHTPVATLSSEELSQRFAEFNRKTITLKGWVVMDLETGTGIVQLNAPEGVVILVEPPKGGFGKPFDLLEGIEVVGLVGGTAKQINVFASSLVSRTPAPAPIEVSAKGVVAEINANHQAAVAKYDGKAVRITGVPDKLWSKATSLQLTGDQSGANPNQEMVLCMVAPPEQGKIPFTTGAPVTLIGMAYFAGEKKEAFVVTMCRSAQPGGQTGPVNPPTGGNPGSGGISTKMPHSPVATLTATELANDPAKYAGKWVVVTGKVKEGMMGMTPDGRKASFPTWENVQLEQQGVRVAFASDHTMLKETVKTGDEAEIWGKVGEMSSDRKLIPMTECMALKPVVEIDALDLFDEFAKDEEKAKEKYSGRTVKVTGVVKRTGPKLLIQGSRDANRRSIDCDNALLTPGVKISEGDKVVVLIDNLLHLDLGIGLIQITGQVRLVSGGK